MAEARARERTPDRTTRQEQNAARMAEVRAGEQTPVRALRLEQNAARMAEVRVGEQTPVRALRLEQNAARMAEVRAGEQTPIRLARRERNAATTDATRARENSSERATRRSANASRQARRRARPAQDEGAALRGDDVGFFDIGRMDKTCQHCHAKLWFLENTLGSKYVVALTFTYFANLIRASVDSANLRFALCCGEGKVLLPAIPNPPPYLGFLLSDNGSEVVPGDGGDDGRHFRVNIRNYNNAMRFSSQGAKYDRELASKIAGAGGWSYRIQGATYHVIRRGLLADQSGREGSNGWFAEMYMYDATVQVEGRGGLFNGGRLRNLQKLQGCILGGFGGGPPNSWGVWGGTPQ